MRRTFTNNETKEVSAFIHNLDEYNDIQGQIIKTWESIPALEEWEEIFNKISELRKVAENLQEDEVMLVNFTNYTYETFITPFKRNR